METLAEYLARVMHQKRITARDIEERSRISNGYISRLLSGKKENVGVATILALADALEVSPFELFAVVSGRSYQVQAVDILKLMEAIETFVMLTPVDQQSALKTMRFLLKQRKKQQKEKPEEK